MHKLSKDLTDHPVAMYLAELDSPASRATMTSALRAVLGLAMKIDPREVDPMAIYEFPWHGLTIDKLIALKAKLSKKYSRAHAAKCYAAVRGILGACYDLELIEADVYARMMRKKGVKVTRNKNAGRMLSDGELADLAIACANDSTAAGTRDSALLGICATQGPRVSEVVKFRLGDYDPATGNLQIRNGKGGEDREIRAANKTKQILEKWIAMRGPEPGPLFTAVNKGGRVFADVGLSKSSLGKMLSKRAKQAGIKPFTLHDLRRTFATNAWALGIPGTQIQRLMGHASIETTAGYDRGSLERALTNGERLHWPDPR